MAKFLDKLNTSGKLTKTILYNLNPCANEVIATMLGNFGMVLYQERFSSVQDGGSSIRKMVWKNR